MKKMFSLLVFLILASQTALAYQVIPVNFVKGNTRFNVRCKDGSMLMVNNAKTGVTKIAEYAIYWDAVVAGQAYCGPNGFSGPTTTTTNPGTFDPARATFGTVELVPAGGTIDVRTLPATNY